MGRLARSESAKAWELRKHWAKQTPVVLPLSERCEPRRLEGLVRHVAVTDAFVIVADKTEGDIHVPMEDVLDVVRPHFSQRQP